MPIVPVEGWGYNTLKFFFYVVSVSTAESYFIQMYATAPSDISSIILFLFVFSFSGSFEYDLVLSSDLYTNRHTQW